MNYHIKSKIALAYLVARNLDTLIRTNKFEEAKEVSSKLREMLEEIQYGEEQYYDNNNHEYYHSSNC